jgi:outer membrane protein assembly factor BamC
MMVYRVFVFTTLLLAMVLLSSCSLLPSADREAYKNSKPAKSLEEPPEIILPKRDSTFDVPDLPKGAVSKKANDEEVLATDVKDVSSDDRTVPELSNITLRSEGRSRWLAVKATPEALWPSLLKFWDENKIKITESDAKLGIIKTDWIVTEAGLAKDTTENTIFVTDSEKDLVLRDQYRLRLERTEEGSNIFLSHTGAEKIPDSNGSERWRLRPSSTEFEAEMLTRLEHYLSHS